MRYLCKHCGYAFNSEKERIRRLCPYCGNNSAVPEESADQLLKKE